MIDGFEQFTSGDAYVVLVKSDVGDFLKDYEKSKPKDVRKTLQILKKLANFGLPYMTDSTSFVREDSFASGNKNRRKMVVYAVKSFQLRVYGGFAKLEGKQCFLCLEAAKKQKDKADRAQLERVAKALGAWDD